MKYFDIKTPTKVTRRRPKSKNQVFREKGEALLYELHQNMKHAEHINPKYL